MVFELIVILIYLQVQWTHVANFVYLWVKPTPQHQHTNNKYVIDTQFLSTPMDEWFWTWFLAENHAQKSLLHRWIACDFLGLTSTLLLMQRSIRIWQAWYLALLNIVYLTIKTKKLHIGHKFSMLYIQIKFLYFGNFKQIFKQFLYKKYQLKSFVFNTRNLSYVPTANCELWGGKFRFWGKIKYYLRIF